ncbi:MAG: hypothetical protein OEO79_04540 [Gemmatimonadota bacterium]|nr:hypothetical protein [Gemmatimonadota bacterium]MDH3421998.1 hypothetical protein [Gemmatimonadota bacterium]
MHKQRTRASLLGVAVLAMIPTLVSGQMDHSQPMNSMEMARLGLGGGWYASGMAQAFPVVTVGDPGGDSDRAIRRTGWYLTQPAIMANVESPNQRFVLRTTLNFEGLTQDDGELTFGGWGEGFIDKRHPHTLLHELMLSVNFYDVGGGDLSLSAGKGFAPYGTSDPMARPGLKYPTNHHLSQILERWTANVAWLKGRWSLEGAVFGGQEPESPYDFSNIESFGDSWSVRAARRWGAGTGPVADWEVSASFARVTEFAHTAKETTSLVNAALRRSAPLGDANLYALVEGSVSILEDHRKFFSVLAEARYQSGRHQPYARFEYARRPEYERQGLSGEEAFFRYEHDEDPMGTTRWLISTAAYAYELTGQPWSLRPFFEVQHHQVRADQGGIAATDLFGTTSFWAISVGARVFLGGNPMRMGNYGVIDPMTEMNRSMNAMPM